MFFIMNLFSSFDPNSSVLGMLFAFNWLAALIGATMMPQLFWLVNSQMSLSYIKIMMYLFKELEAVFNKNILPGSIFIFISLFFYVFFSNFMGLMPYIFTPTSHLSMTLSLALPIWLGSMTLSIIFQWNSIMAHLVPVGTPGFLMPVMVIIETVSSVIRPATLAIRLAANMVAGHLLLTLLGSQAPSLPVMNLVLLMVGLIMLLLLEVAVACIQSYVFTILSSLYLNELVSVSFNKKMI